MIENPKTGQIMFSRRTVLVGGGAIAALGAGAIWGFRKKPAPIGFQLDEQQLADAQIFLQQNPAFDMHAHPGRTFVRGAKGLAPKLKLYQALGTFEKRSAADMRAGGVAGAAFASVSDFNVLDARDSVLQVVREFAPGEAWNSFVLQNSNMQKLIEKGLFAPLASPSDLISARNNKQPGAWFSAEGADFLEASVQRLHEAHDMGLRCITLMHFRTSELGDSITSKQTHYGLTPAGKSIVLAMNDLMMVIDVAHASQPTAYGILAASQHPVICSHTHIIRENAPEHPRFISLELAREIAGGGGIIGAWPAGIGIFSLNGFIDRVFELIDAVGIDHVGLGTDMDANYKPVMDNYRQMPVLVAGLLARGLSQRETAKIIGGNFIRLWRQISG